MLTSLKYFTLVIGIGLVSSAFADTSRPNILLIFTDDHSQRPISAYGPELTRHPISIVSRGKVPYFFVTSVRIPSARRVGRRC